MSSIGGLISVLVVLGFVPDQWLCDMASQFRLVYPLLLVPCLIGLLILKCRIGVAIVSLAILLNAAPVLTMCLREERLAGKYQKPLTILNFNTEFQHNERFDLFNSLVMQRDPDIVVLVEVDQKWIDSTETVMRKYVYKQVIISGAGLAIFSKYPIENFETRYFGKSHHPWCTAILKIAGEAVRVVIAHPTTPKSDGAFHERNAEICQLQNEIAALPSPKILIADLNCGPWSAAFTGLLSSGLKDSERGWGPQPSWPARAGRLIEGVAIPPVVPIDHVLVSKDIFVLNRVAGPAIGSDHLPVLVKIELQK